MRPPRIPAPHLQLAVLTGYFCGAEPLPAEERSAAAFLPDRGERFHLLSEAFTAGEIRR